MRAAADCGKTDGGDVREEIVVGNAGGGKPGSHGSKKTSPLPTRMQAQVI